MKNRNLDHKDDWATPKEFYDKLNEEFHFTFDPCPFQHDMSWDWLKVEWVGNSIFINPPYSLNLKTAFIKRAIEESKKWKTCVMLLPVSTSTKAFHNYILPNKKEIRFLKWRLRFKWINEKWQFVNWDNPTDENIYENWYIFKKYVNNSGMHDSMLVIF